MFLKYRNTVAHAWEPMVTNNRVQRKANEKRLLLMREEENKEMTEHWRTQEEDFNASFFNRVASLYQINLSGENNKTIIKSG